MSGAAFTPAVIAVCICCGGSDDPDCQDVTSWLRVNYEEGVGVCSGCPEACANFDEHFATEPLETTIPNSEPRSLAS